MIDTKYKKEIDIPTDKNFAFTFFFIFIILSIILFIFNKNYYYILSIFCASFFLIMGIFSPGKLNKLNMLWFKFGQIISKVTFPIIIFILYFFIIVPYAFIIKLFKRDILNERIDKSKNSYWIKRKDPINSMSSQF